MKGLLHQLLSMVAHWPNRSEDIKGWWWIQKGSENASDMLLLLTSREYQNELQALSELLLFSVSSLSFSRLAREKIRSGVLNEWEWFYVSFPDARWTKKKWKMLFFFLFSTKAEHPDGHARIKLPRLTSFNARKNEVDDGRPDETAWNFPQTGVMKCSIRHCETKGCSSLSSMIFAPSVNRCGGWGCDDVSNGILLLR